MDIDKAAKDLNINPNALAAAITNLHATVVARGEETDRKIDENNKSLSKIQVDIAVIKKTTEYTEDRIKTLEREKSPTRAEVKTLIDSGVQKKFAACTQTFATQSSKKSSPSILPPKMDSFTWAHVMKISVPLVIVSGTVFLAAFGLN